MKYKLANHITLTEVDNEVVLLDINAGHYYGINHIGVYFLNALNKQKSIDSIINAIAQDYKQDIVKVKQDIDELITSLLKQRLLIEQ